MRRSSGGGGGGGGSRGGAPPSEGMSDFEKISLGGFSTEDEWSDVASETDEMALAAAAVAAAAHDFVQGKAEAEEDLKRAEADRELQQRALEAECERGKQVVRRQVDRARRAARDAKGQWERASAEVEQALGAEKAQDLKRVLMEKEHEEEEAVDEAGQPVCVQAAGEAFREMQRKMATLSEMERGLSARLEALEKEKGERLMQIDERVDTAATHLEDVNTSPTELRQMLRQTNKRIDAMSARLQQTNERFDTLMDMLVLFTILPSQPHRVRQIGYSVERLHEMKVPVSAMSAAGYSLQDMEVLGLSDKELREQGYSVQLMRAGGRSLEDMRAAGYLAGELHRVGYSLRELHDAGFTAQEFRDAGISMAMFVQIGFTAADLIQAQWTSVWPGNRVVYVGEYVEYRVEEEDGPWTLAVVRHVASTKTGGKPVWITFLDDVDLDGTAHNRQGTNTFYLPSAHCRPTIYRCRPIGGVRLPLVQPGGAESSAAAATAASAAAPPTEVSPDK